MNRLLTFRIIAAAIILTFISCSKDSDDPVPQEIEITVSTEDFSTTMDENPTNGQIIGTVQGSTNEGAITFSIRAQNPAGAFSIDSASGELKVADEALFEFETNPTISGTVQVSNGAVSENASVTISLNEQNIYELPYIRLWTQEDVNLFGANQYTRIMGTLYIGTPYEGYTTDISDLSPLGSIKTVDANLKIRNNPDLISTTGLGVTHIGEGLIVSENKNLENLDGLEGLTYVQYLQLIHNFALSDFSSLSQLTSLDNGLYLSGCYLLTDVDWLSNVASIGNVIDITNNPNLTNINGLSNLRNFTGEPDYISFNTNINLTNLNGLRNLTANVSNLSLFQNYSLVNIDGLANIQVTKSINIRYNHALENIDGLESTIGLEDELFIFHNISLRNLFGLQQITNIGKVTIDENENLLSLNGLENLLRVSQSFRARQNSNLSDFCALTNLCVNGDLNILQAENNAYNPTKQDIIDGNCSL
ncbi:cadherin repeat domain-containing protein [Aequorivita sp. F47161]|uniref:Cadherin repeat domain-containing protein n=1 Tax=Aequorivita vitellina TaxID=2874475 RepID=A0A9X1U1W4_9FLAO|nr:cadherin repeat domain-containing protein [Aequorivita vitellina]MCG2420064.1 cadherin repeat domain-containing protein [Aequorivita vitellina]